LRGAVFARQMARILLSMSRAKGRTIIAISKLVYRRAVQSSVAQPIVKFLDRLVARVRRIPALNGARAKSKAQNKPATRAGSILSRRSRVQINFACNRVRVLNPARPSLRSARVAGSETVVVFSKKVHTGCSGLPPHHQSHRTLVTGSRSRVGRPGKSTRIRRSGATIRKGKEPASALTANQAKRRLIVVGLTYTCLVVVAD